VVAQRSFWKNVTVVTAAVALAGTIVSSFVSLFGSTTQNEKQFRVEICKLAYHSLDEGTLNPVLTPDEARQFITLQLRIAQKCGNFER
jgi:hypothetical protein